MIRPGVCLCPICGCTSDRPFYAADVTADAGWLKKSADQGYYVESFGSARKIYHLPDPDAPAADDGWPDEVEVCLNDSGSDRVTMRRCCPDCFSGRMDNKSVKTRFKHFVGRVPLFVVAVVGTKSAGKTAWLGALSSGAMGPLNRQNYPYKAFPSKPGDVVEVSRSTIMVGDKGNSNYIEIWDKSRPDGKPVAMVLVLDAAGENYSKFAIEDIFTASAAVDSPVRRLFYGDGPLNPGIDGAILIDPAVHGKTAENTVRLFHGMIEKLRTVPVAYVYTYADELIYAQKNRTDKNKPPLLTWDTFPNTTYTGEHFTLLKEHFHPDRIRERMVIQEEIAQTVQMPGYEYILMNCDNCHGFIVRSCKPIPAADGREAENDYTEQFNVADPLLWMLAKLRLFPMRLQKGGAL